MKAEIKSGKQATHIVVAKSEYAEIQGSRVSWRKKSSYRKPIKRRMNKLIRKALKPNLDD